MKHTLSFFLMTLLLLCGFFTACKTPETITIYESKTEYIEKPLTVTNLIIKGRPEKTEYIEEEDFDPAGIKVYAIYSDGSKKIIKDFKTDFKEITKNLSGLNISIDILFTYEGATDSISTTINRSNQKLTSKPILCEEQTGTYTGTDSIPAVYYLFGDYPQTENTEPVILSSKKTSNGYYIGEDGNLYQVYKDKQYKVEPVKWRVLNTKITNPDNYSTSKKALFLCENIIDSGLSFYCNNSSSANAPYERRYEDTGILIFPNNYMFSSVRAFLNGINGRPYHKVEKDKDNSMYNFENEGFLQMAFTKSAQSLIPTTLVKNDISQASDYKGKITSLPEKRFTCPDTNDKIFILSVYESTIPDYGFEEDGTKTDTTKIRKYTNYSAAKDGTSANNKGHWALRSPHSSKTECKYIYNDGKPDNYCQTNASQRGIVPALYVFME